MFEEFVEAAAEQSRSASPSVKAIENVTVLGGGYDARLLAALCFAEGAQVQVFSAYAAELEAMGKGIAVDGAGPVGRYHVQPEHGERPLATAVKTTSSIDTCVADAELVFLTGPVHKQRTYAMVLADHLHDGQIIVLPNARTFGAFEASWLLKVGGCNADITLVEMQGLPFWIEPVANGVALQAAEPVLTSCLPASRSQATIEVLSMLLPGLQPEASVLHTSLLDCSALVELPALLMGGCALTAGGKPIPMGGVPLEENQSFYNLLGKEQLQVVAQLLEERKQVSARFGVRDFPDLDAALARHAGSNRGDGRRVIPDKACATELLRDGAIGSLVPLIDAARVAGVNTPLTESIVHLACAVLGSDVSVSGRRLINLGVQADQFDDVYTQLSASAKAGG